MPPTRVKKARYFEDKRFTERVLPPPALVTKQAASRPGSWVTIMPLKVSAEMHAGIEKAEQDTANSGLRREPELPDHVAIVKETTEPCPHKEFAMIDDEPEDTVRQARAFRQQARGVARQVSMDPGDGIEM